MHGLFVGLVIFGVLQLQMDAALFVNSRSVYCTKYCKQSAVTLLVTIAFSPNFDIYL